ncbi:MAG: glutathione S-transferase family protein [Candidatus Dadabacteria bacterium]|nr:glutathione S-transferase family protein [Candidatus Dadabacteria bacterium]
MIRLYEHPLSGNAYKAKLLLHQLSVEYEGVTVDIFAGEHKKEEFSALNPNCKIPVLSDGDFVMWESNAILFYLANKFSPNPYLSDDPETYGLIAQWTFFGKTTIDPNLALARYFAKFLPPDQVPPGVMEKLHAQGNVALAILEDHLSRTEFLSGDYSIADIACYPYTMLCEEGGFDLEPYPSVRRWCGSVEGTPDFIAFAG